MGSAAALGLLLLVSSAVLATGGDTLRATGVRHVWSDFRLTSANGHFFAAFQSSDGNFVVYSVNPNRALWSSRTVNVGARTLAMQADGNLVIYSGSNRPLWSSHSAGTKCAGSVRLVMQNDGNLVVYDCQGARWHTGTHG